MRRTVRMLGFSILAASLSLSTTRAQNPSDNPLLRAAEARQRVIVSKLTADLRKALDDAARLQPTSKIRAVNVLKNAMVGLDDPLVPAGFRQEWTANLNGAVARIEKGENAVPPAPAFDSVKREVKEAERARARAIIEERDTVRRSFGKIEALSKGGRPDLAQEEVSELVKKYPDNPAVLIMADNASMTQRIADAKVAVGQQSEGFLLAMRSVDRSAVPPRDDIEFDVKRWKEITKARMGPKMTAKEQAILKALDTPVDVNYKDAPFEEVIRSISKGMNQDILLDKQALQAAMIDTNTPTTLKSPRGVLSARTALRSILQEHNLTFIIRDQSIQVVTLEAARASMVTRVYPLGDVVQGVGPFSNFGGAALNFGPWVDLMQTQENVNRIIEMVKGSIDPESWKERGGNGTITFHFPSMALVVRQTSEVHSMLGKTFGGGR